MLYLSRWFRNFVSFKFDVRTQLNRIEETINNMAVSLAALTDAVNSLVTIVNNAISDLNNLSTEITQLKNSNSDPATQASLDALAQKVTDQVAALTAGVNANQPQ